MVYIVFMFFLKFVFIYCLWFIDYLLCEFLLIVKFVFIVIEYFRLCLIFKWNGELVSVLCLYFFEIIINLNYIFFFKF